MVVHNKFTDPAPVGARPEYTWPINHDTEGEQGRERSIDTSQNVAGTRTIQTQGDLTPMVKDFRGSALVDAQIAEMLAWQALCESRTIILTDFSGAQYEGLISSFKYARQRVAANSRQPGSPWKWTYTLQFTVVRVLAGFEVGQPA